VWIHCPVCVLYVDVDFRVFKSIDSHHNSKLKLVFTNSKSEVILAKCAVNGNATNVLVDVGVYSRTGLAAMRDES